MKVIKKYGKKAVSLILASLMATSMLPMSAITASAADNLTVTIDTGAEVTLKDADGDDYYDIGTADELYAFAAAVNSGNTTINGELTDDIVVNTGDVAGCNGVKQDGWREWVPIGLYDGTFDGQNHTISGLYCNSQNLHIGLVGTLYGTVKNVGVVNNYFYSTVDRWGVIGGIAGVIYTTATVTNCYNTGTISGYSSNDEIDIGGIVGYNYGTITDCYNTGSIRGDGDALVSVGGIEGTDDRGTLINCYNIGKVSGNGTKELYIGGIVGWNYVTDLTNCYNTGTVSSESENAMFGGIAAKVDNSTIINCHYLSTCGGEGKGTSKTAEQFASGEVAYLLQGEQTEQIWGQDIDNDNDIQLYPTFTGAKVYQVINCNNEYCYRNTNENIDHNWIDANCTTPKTCSVCKLTDGEALGHEYDNYFCSICNTYLPATDENGDGVYEIANFGQLYWFADFVNAGNTSANAVLTDDIVINAGYTFNSDGTVTKDGEAVTEGFREWTPIGSSKFNYNGTFDGQNHTISGLYFNKNIDYVGLFGYVYEGTIKNVGIINNYINAGDYVGGIIGYSYSSTVTNCYNSGTVISSNCDSSYVGGVIGLSGFATVTNCYNTGTVSSSNCDKSLVGGVIGVSARASTVTNCYNSGTVISSNCDKSYVGGVIGSNGNTTVTNCYNTGTVSSSDCNYSYVGGVIGSNGNTIVTNCYNTGTVISSNCDLSYIGGVVGYNDDCKVTNCYNLGTVSSSNCDESRVGGVVGYNDDSVVTNCYNTGNISGVTVDGTATCGSIVGINQGTITNSYYLADEETEDGGKTSEQFASGEVAYLLGEAFGQKIGTDACPVLAGDKIYCGYKDCTTTEKVYSNSPLYDSYEEIPEHTHEFADIDFDGRLTVRDATALAKALAGITTLTDCQQAVADVNNDGMININDVTYIQMMLADLV